MSKEVKGIGQGWRHFIVLTRSGAIKSVHDIRFQSKYFATEESYIETRQYFEEFDVQVLIMYKTLLKSKLAMWQSWLSTMPAFKTAIIGVIIGSLLPLSLPSILKFIFNSFTLQRIVELYWLSLLLVPLIMLTILRLIWGPSSVSKKIEMATFYLEILGEVISNKRNQSKIETMHLEGVPTKV